MILLHQYFWKIITLITNIRYEAVRRLFLVTACVQLVI